MGHEIPYHYVKSDKSHCGTSLWAGKERYSWIDISSQATGDIQYGPSTMGEGVVTAYSIPRLAHYTKNGEVLIHELASHLVTIVRRTCLQLVTPSLEHFPVPYWSRTVIHLVKIKDGLAKHDSSEDHFDFELIKTQLAKLQLVGQSISFKVTEVNFEDCEACGIAFHASRQVHTTTLDGGSFTIPGAYLDSEMLHTWLVKLQGTIVGLEGPQFPGERVLPVFLYELGESHAITLELNKQAVGFKDMIVAVQSPAGHMRLPLSCGSKPLTFDSNDVTRPVLAALLQGGWGISATHQNWEPAAQRLQTDWLWAVGPTVFGYFSEERELTFPLIDAAMRSVLYTVIAESIDEVHRFVSDFARFGKEMDEVLSTAQHVEFVRRWNVYQYKLEKSGLYISLHNYEHAMYYLLSVKHDIAALRDVVRQAGQGLHSTMVCQKVYSNVQGRGSARLWYVTAFVVITLFCWWPFKGGGGGALLMRERVKRNQD